MVVITCYTPLYTMPEFSFTVTGAPMISLRKPLGSLESPLLSGAGLCDMVAECDVCRKSFLCLGQVQRGEVRRATYMQDEILKTFFGSDPDAVCANDGYSRTVVGVRGERRRLCTDHASSPRSRRDKRDCASIRRSHPASLPNLHNSKTLPSLAQPDGLSSAFMHLK
jgi:hypothetical protein